MFSHLGKVDILDEFEVIQEQYPTRKEGIKVQSIHPEIDQILAIVNLKMCKDHPEKAITIEHLKNEHNFVQWDNIHTFVKDTK